MLSSPYLSGLQQYGVDGQASYRGAAFDSSDPNRNGFSDDDLRQVLENAIDNGGLPDSDDDSVSHDSIIYAVITAPGYLSDQGNHQVPRRECPFAENDKGYSPDCCKNML
jgi:hypothetical protein